MRQVLETIAMAFLASKPVLGYLERYVSGRYSTNFAVRDVLKKADKLNLNSDALKILRQSHEFFHNFSHPTLLTIATITSLSDDMTYFGASFDPEKQYAYDKEINTRVQVAGLLANMIEGIRHNLDGRKTC